MSYKPADHAVAPRQIVAAWAVCAALLVMALGANINHANSDNGGRSSQWSPSLPSQWSAGCLTDSANPLFRSGRLGAMIW
jgi:hypothetical protein